ncbi:hypothetical protein JD969_04105 [Planctomycetota bacterium]|nr:hypothetical protein JD969_04105 [Planctomycetota bacterium]
MGSSLQSLVGPGVPVQGTLNGEEVTVEETRWSATQLEILRRYVPQLGIMTSAMLEADGEYERSLLWYMIQHDSQRLGISASNMEAYSVLAAIGIDQTGVQRIANQMKAQEGVVLDAVKSWLIAEAYSELMLGKSHESIYSRIGRFNQIAQAYSQVFGQMALTFAAQQSEDPYRVSKPLIAHYLQDQKARVGGEAVVIPADLYLEDIAEPNEAELTALFDEYKNNLPGQGQYGFGYKIPDRVKLEYIGIPLDEVMSQVSVEPAEANEFYRANKERFVKLDEENKPIAGEYQTFAEVYTQISEGLKQRKAFELAQQIAKTALADLEKPLASVKKKQGYYAFNKDFIGISMRTVAEELEREFKVRVQQYNSYKDKWIDVDRIGDLPGIGMSYAGGRQDAPFTTYVASAKQLDPNVDTNPLIALYLQVEVPSQIMIGQDGSVYIFRLVEAEAAHAPASMADVKTQVMTDAKLKLAYAKLLDETQQWLELAKSSGLDAVAKQAKTDVRRTGLVPRIELGGIAASDQTPDISGIGKSRELVDAMYQIARDSGKSGDLKEEVAADKRTGEAPLEQKLSLVVFRVDDYNLMTETEYKVDASNYMATANLMNYSIFNSDRPHILSYKMMSEKLNWVPDRAAKDEDAELEAPATPEEQPAQDTPEAA